MKTKKIAPSKIIEKFGRNRKCEFYQSSISHKKNHCVPPTSRQRKESLIFILNELLRQMKSILFHWMFRIPKHEVSVPIYTLSIFLKHLITLYTQHQAVPTPKVEYPQQSNKHLAACPPSCRTLACPTTTAPFFTLPTSTAPFHSRSLPPRLPSTHASNLHGSLPFTLPTSAAPFR